MSDKTRIEWTDATWSPVQGCTKVSEGCDHCYIERTPPFRMNYIRFACPRCSGTGRVENGECHRCEGRGRIEGPGDTTGVRLLWDQLEKPLHWRNPRKVFVCSLSDLFHPAVTDEFIARLFATMALAPQHTFQVLTKRPGRMRSLLSSSDFRSEVYDQVVGRSGRQHDEVWPLPNVWVGTSVESSKWLDRIRLLAETPAAIRYLSCEPLLGSVLIPDEYAPHIDWVIVGGESGPKSRPMNPDWARGLRDQCTDMDIAFHFKQWGGRTPKANGRELDGRTWDEYPEARQ